MLACATTGGGEGAGSPRERLLLLQIRVFDVWAKMGLGRLVVSWFGDFCRGVLTGFWVFCAVCGRWCAVGARLVNVWLFFGMGWCYFGVFWPHLGVVLGGLGGGACSGFEAGTVGEFCGSRTPW